MSVSFPTSQMTGLASGLDWGQIVDEHLKKARKAQEPWYDKIQLLSDKIFLYQEFAGSVNGLKKTLDALKLESTFTAKTPEVVVIGSNANPDSILKADLDPKAQIDDWSIKIDQIAKAERRLSDRQEGAAAALGKGGSFFIRSGTKAVEITYNASDSIRSVADKIRRADAGVDAYLIDNRLVIESKNTGMGHQTFTEEITRGSGDEDLLGGNGIDPDSIETIAGIYKKGEDFTVKYDQATRGYKIKWLTSGSRPTAKYDVTYEHDANTFQVYEIRDSHTKTITRGTAEQDLLDIADLDPGSITVHDATATYEEGTDYEIEDAEGGKKAIKWLPGASSPTGDYDITYSTLANSFLQSIGITADDPEHHTQAQDALLSVDGVDVERSSNDIDDLIGGAVLHLKGAGEVKLEVSLNAENAVNAIQTFVDSYNDLMEYISIRSEEKTYNYSDKPNSDTKARPTDDMARRKGLLAGDSLLWQTKSNLRRIISETHRPMDKDGKYLDSTLKYLSEIGITTESANFGKSGKLEFDTSKFMEAMTKDPSGVRKLVDLATEKTQNYLDGVISTSNIATGETTSKKGKVPNRIALWEQEVSRIQKRIKDHESRLAAQQISMYKQYATMERHMIKLQAQASALANIFANLNRTSSASGNKG